MLTPICIVALVLAQDAGSVPEEAKGLPVLWVPAALASTSNTTPGFKFRHPKDGKDLSFAKAKDFAAILDQLPEEVRRNGIWVSTSNEFLYSEAEEAQLKALAGLAKAKKIHVFRAEVGKQPADWRKVDG